MHYDILKEYQMACLFKDDGIICKKENLIKTITNCVWNCSIDYNEYFL